jgi:hypothetical protein
MVVYRPEQIINLYVWEQFKTYAPEFYRMYAPVVGNQNLGIVPFFPSPASNLPTPVLENDLPYIVFDKFSRVRGGYKYFYPIKTDQMRYTIHGGSLWGINKFEQDRFETTYALTSLIQNILDREDDAARDINEFAKDLPGYAQNPDGLLSNGNVDLNQYYFHCINVYQSGFTDNQQDVSDFMEYNPTRDLIIKYDYHSPQFGER